MNTQLPINSTDFYASLDPQSRIEFLLQYAVRAPSTHNIQPWLFKINQDSCDIYFDETKSLPEGDKLGRDLYISLGCCIENLAIAAEHFEVLDSVIIRAKGTWVATVKFKNLTAAPNKQRVSKSKSLLAAIQTRTNARGLFNSKIIPAALIKQIKNIKSHSVKVHLISNPDQIKGVASLTERGLQMAYRNRNFRREISAWVRSNISLKKDGIPGYSLTLPLLPSLLMPFIMRFFNIGAKLGKLNASSIESAPTVCAITAQRNSKATWLEVGRVSERIMLLANTYGARTSVFVASIEMGDLYKELQLILKTKDIPQFLFCIGYMPNVSWTTPRRQLSKHIIKESPRV